jgi:hypothetical protein
MISSDLAVHAHADLAAGIEKLRSRTALLGTAVGLFIALPRTTTIQLSQERQPKWGR